MSIVEGTLSPLSATVLLTGCLWRPRPLATSFGKCAAILDNNLIIVDKDKKTAYIIDIAVPGENRVGTKELEKNLKYQDLKMEISRMWMLNQVEVIPIVVGALGKVSKRLEGSLEKIRTVIPVEMLQKTVLLGTARIIRRVMDMKNI